jgi:hypothetical protein
MLGVEVLIASFRHQDMPFQPLIDGAEQSEGHGSLHADKLQPLDLLSY